MGKSISAYTAVVLAADRAPGDVVAGAAGVRCKCLAPVGGKPMVLRVLDALDQAQTVDSRILCGPPRSIVNQTPDLLACIQSQGVHWVENQATPSSSAFHALMSLPHDTPVLLTTADHALLDARIVDYFCSAARKTGCDLAVGIASHEMLMSAYPGTRRTVTRLRDGAYCSCNLFAFLTPRARSVADFWRRVENQRKKPLRVVGVLGWVAVARYLMGRLTLEEGLNRISHRLEISVGAVNMPFPEAAIDVDTVNDWKFVQTVLEKPLT